MVRIKNRAQILEDPLDQILKETRDLWVVLGDPLNPTLIEPKGPDLTSEIIEVQNLHKGDHLEGTFLEIGFKDPILEAPLDQTFRETDLRLTLAEVRKAPVLDHALKDLISNLIRISQTKGTAQDLEKISCPRKEESQKDTETKAQISAGILKAPIITGIPRATARVENPKALVISEETLSNHPPTLVSPSAMKTTGNVAAAISYPPPSSTEVLRTKVGILVPVPQ